MFRQADELTPEGVFDAEWLESLPMMTQVGYRAQVENSRRWLLENVHKFDTHEPILLLSELTEGGERVKGRRLIQAPQ
jgi:hypothetical protein